MLVAEPTEHVWRIRPGVVEDSYGDPVESWPNASKIRLRGASKQSVSAVEEDGANRRLLTDEALLFCPGRPDLRSEDRVRIGHEVWRVDGTPVVRRGLAIGDETVANLRRYTAKSEERQWLTTTYG